MAVFWTAIAKNKDLSESAKLLTGYIKERVDELVTQVSTPSYRDLRIQGTKLSDGQDGHHSSSQIPQMAYGDFAEVKKGQVTILVTKPGHFQIFLPDEKFIGNDSNDRMDVSVKHIGYQL